MAKLDKETARQLDAEIMQMSEDQQHKLSTKGNRILKGMDTGGGKKKAREYMVMYRARIALAEERGLIEKHDH